MTVDNVSDVILYRKAKERIISLLGGTGKQVLLIGIEDKHPSSVTHVVGAVNIPVFDNGEANCKGVDLGEQGAVLLNP